MKTIFTSAILFLTVQFHVFAQDKDTSSYFVEYTKINSFTKEEVKALWKEKGIPKFIAPVEYGVDIYEIIYRAPWVDGSMIKASGLYFVPQTDKSLPLGVFHHGTQLEKKREAFEKSGQQSICFGLASDGYLVLMPDYYGIGKGEKVHLYQHAWSEAMSTIYMLYAAEELNQKLNKNRNGQLFLTGYSQGGHATMAAHKYIQELNDPRFQVTASAPLSGAYDMSGAQAEVMFKPYSQPFYLPYLLVSYQEAYNVWPDNIYNVFKSPYDTLIPPFFNGERGIKDFNKVLPKVPSDMLKEELVKEFKTNPDFAMRKKIEENDLTNWVPKAPVLLVYSEGDEQVYYKNSIVAHDKMTQNGAKDIRLRRASKVLDHNGVAMFAVMDTKFFFEAFRNNKNGKRDKGPLVKRFLINQYKKKKEKEYVKKQEEKKQRENQDLRAGQ